MTRSSQLPGILVVLAGLWLSSPLPSAGATLSGTFVPIPQGTNVNLTAEGSLDWVHWGLFTDSSITRKAGVQPQLPDFVPIGFNGPYQYADNYNGYSWIDGTPTTGIPNTPTGVWMYGQTNGFLLDVPADLSSKTLKLYVGTFAAVGKFEATLSGTTLAYRDASITNTGNGPGGVYILDYSADFPGQTLIITYTVETIFQSVGNVTLQAAALAAPGANNPPTVSITSPADNSISASPDAITIKANAFDSDGTVTRVEFFRDTTKLGAATTSPYSITWDAVPPGEYVLTATATDDGGATRTSAPVKIFVHGRGGTLTGSVSFPPARVDLTAEGTADWAHWGLVSPGSFNHKAGVTQQISNFVSIGTNSVNQFKDNSTAYTWIDGRPKENAIDTPTGVFVHGLNDGFLLTAPADANVRTLKVYLGLYGAEGNLQAYLSDFSAPAYTDTSLKSVYGNPNGVYTFTYSAALGGQTLTVRYTARNLFDDDYGNITLQAATLSGASVPTNSPPVVAITGPTNNATFAAPNNVPITADASDGDGSVTQVEFFDGTISLGVDASAPFSINVALAPGAHTLTAKAADNEGATATSEAVLITVTNTANSAVRLVAPGFNGNQFNFSFATQTGLPYQVQFTDALSAIQWQTLEDIVGDGTTRVVTDTGAVGQQRYYRVKTQ